MGIMKLTPWTCPTCLTHNRVEASRCKQCGLAAATVNPEKAADDPLRTAIARKIYDFVPFVDPVTYGADAYEDADTLFHESVADRIIEKVLADPALLRAVLEATGHEVREGWANGWFLTCFDVFGPTDAYADEDAEGYDENGDLTRVLVVRPRGETTDA